jgi:adapter protein MecA 1/2
MRILKVNDNTVRILTPLTELADRNISLLTFPASAIRNNSLGLITKAREEGRLNLDQPFWIQATVASEDDLLLRSLNKKIRSRPR